MIVEQAIACPLPGLEMVTVVYNLMASEAELNAFHSQMGAQGSAGPLIVRVDGWPLNGHEPWGESAPLLWRFWVTRTGFAQAMAQWLNNPNFTTASTPS